MKHVLPKLPYAYDALEPFIDARTMEIHLTKHHQTYIDKLNGVLDKYPELSDTKLEDLMRKLQSLKINEKDKSLLKNHGGGHLNHSLFWNIMGPKKNTDQGLITRIKEQFGTIDGFTAAFTDAAVYHFGSGWAWLVENENKKLEVYSLPNQDSPYLLGHTPIIGLDVWEHAYYLNYQNRRADYVKNWWNVLSLI